MMTIDIHDIQGKIRTMMTMRRLFTTLTIVFVLMNGAAEARDKLTLVLDWSINPEYLGRIVPLVQPRLETLADWGHMTAPFFADEVPLEPGTVKIKGNEPDEVAAILQMTIGRLDGQREFTGEALQSLFRELAEEFEVKLRDFLLPFYVALSGSPVWTPLFDSMEILGSDLVRTRLRRAIRAGGGIPKKKLKESDPNKTKRPPASPNKSATPKVDGLLVFTNPEKPTCKYPSLLATKPSDTSGKKTSLCMNFLLQGRSCRFGPNCNFIHATKLNEIPSTIRNEFKT